MLRCSVCGEDVNIYEKTCSSCGASIDNKSGSSKTSSSNNLKNPANSNTKNESSKSKKSSNTKQDAIKLNSVSSTKLFYLVFFLILIGAILIYSTGVFDSAPKSFSSQQGNANNPHAGVDLKNLEQINTLEGIVKQNPKDYQSLLQLAHLLNDSGFKEKAVEKYIAYLKQFPKEEDVWVDMGVCYFELGKNDDAITSMERGLKINPNHQIANLNLGIVNMTAGNKEKAVGYWKKAIEIDPSNEIGKKAKELITTH